MNSPADANSTKHDSTTTDRDARRARRRWCRFGKPARLVVLPLGVVLIAGICWLATVWLSHRAEIVSYQEGNKYGFRTRGGKVITPARYDDVKGFSEGLAPVMVGNKWGYIDTTGKLVIEFQFDDTYGFHEGRAAVTTSELVGFIDKKGAVVIAPKFTFTSDFSEGLAVVHLKNRCAFIDPSGKEVIPFGRYEDAGMFSEGLAAVKKEGKWGYIDKSSEIVIAPQFDKAYHFHDGQARVGFGKKRFKYTKIDRMGKQLYPPRYKEK